MPLLLLGLPLLGLLAVLVAYGFSQLQHGQSHGFIGWLQSVAESSLFFVAPVAELAIKLTSWLTHMLGQYFEAGFHRVVQFFTGISQYLVYTAKIALGWPFYLFKLQQWLVWHAIPRIATAIAHEAVVAAGGLVKVVRVVEQKVVKFPKLAEAVAKAALIALIPFPLVKLWGVIGWIISHFKAIVHAVAHTAGAIAGVPGLIWKDVTAPFGRTISQVRRYLRRLRWLLAFTSATALVAAALQKMGLHWIRCNNVKRLGRSICGSPAWLINLLAAGVVEAFVVGDLCRFTLLLEAEAEKFKPVLLELVNVENSLINCGDNSAPGPLSLPPLSLPLMPAPSAFAA